MANILINIFTQQSPGEKVVRQSHHSFAASERFIGDHDGKVGKIHPVVNARTYVVDVFMLISMRI